MRILTVDSDPLIRRFVQVTLVGAGHEVEEVDSGTVAWHLLQRDPFRLVITASTMQGMDSRDLIRHIRTDLADYTYILLLTTKDAHSDIVVGLETGADDYLVKPCDPDELLARVSIGERILSLEMRLRTSVEQLTVLALHDNLTGLLNRRAIQGHVQAEWDRSTREKRAMSLALLDIDHFKAVNDRLGHLVGDQVLCWVAGIVAQSKRSYDWIGRWGGEEFLLVLPNTDLETAGMVADRLRSKIASSPLVLPNQTRLELHVSIGVASNIPKDTASSPESIDALLQQVDRALNRAKRGGRNRVRLFTGS